MDNATNRSLGVAVIQCNICTHTWSGVFHLGTEDRLECPSCGFQDSTIIEAREQIEEGTI